MKNLLLLISAVGLSTGISLWGAAPLRAELLCRPAYEGELCTGHAEDYDAAIYQWRSPDQRTQVSMIRNSERTLSMFKIETFNSAGNSQETTAFSLQNGGQIVFSREYSPAWHLLHDNADIIFQLLLDNEYGLQNPM